MLLLCHDYAKNYADYAKLCSIMLNYARLCFMPKLCQLCPLARGAAGGAQPPATLVRVSGPITRGQKNARATMSTIRSPDLMLLVVVRTTVRTRTRRTTTVHQSIP